MSQRYANILKDLVEDQEDSFITAQTFNINNKFIIREEFCDFETNVDMSTSLNMRRHTACLLMCRL